jgi:hypothetical protein
LKVIAPGPHSEFYSARIDIQHAEYLYAVKATGCRPIPFDLKYPAKRLSRVVAIKPHTDLRSQGLYGWYYPVMTLDLWGNGMAANLPIL